MNNIIGCCKDNLNVRVYTVVVLVCFQFYSCKLYMCHIFIGQKSGGMVTKTTFRPWNPICLMNHAGWHEVDPALTSWKLQKKSREKRQPLHGTVTNFGARLCGQRDGILRGQGTGFFGFRNQNKYYNWLHFSPFKEGRPTFIWLEAAQ